MQPKNNILQFGRDNLSTSNPDVADQNNGFQSKSRKSHSLMHQDLLDNVAGYSIQWINDVVSALFDNVDNQLFEMAEKSERATDQNTYFDAMRVVRLRRNITHEVFIDNINQGFSPDKLLVNKQDIKVTSDIDSLSLINDDTLEEDLATHGMIAKAERDNREILSHLNQRLAYLYQGININNENNPLGPNALCNAFSVAIESLEADIKVKLLIFKLFDINVVTKLAGLYEPANRILVDNNILSDLKTSYRQTPGRPSATPANRQTDNFITPDNAVDLGNFIHQPTGMDTSNDAETFALLQQLIAQNKRGTPTYEPQTGSNYASTNDIIDTLHQIQVQPVTTYNTQNGAATSALLKEALKQSLQANNHLQNINQKDDDMIDVIGMLFDFILDDKNLVDSVKTLISRLQIPIIKIALQDKSFFSNKNHPARKLLNDIASSGLGVTDEVPARDNPLYLKLEYLINRVLNEMPSTSDTSLFDELVDDLERFTVQFNHGLKKGKIPSRDAALKLVETELDSRLAKKQVPHTIILLLERVWKDVMFDIFFHEGMESDEWDMAMTFIDTLIWSIDPKINIQSQKQLVRVIPGILNALNAGLDRIQYPKDLREHLLQDLQNCHLACMRGKSIDENRLSHDDSAYISTEIPGKQQSQIEESRTDQAAATGKYNSDFQSDTDNQIADPATSVDDFMFEKDLDNLEALDEEELLASLENGSEEAIADQGEDELIEDNFTHQARNLNTGSWVDFYGPENITYRAKISWMSEDSSAFIFVTQTGQIAEKSLAGLSAALRNQQAKVLDESPVFERALDAVLEGLQ